MLTSLRGGDHNNSSDLPQPAAEIAKPIGDALKISGEGTSSQKNHYKALKFRGKNYELDDTVLVAHETQGQMKKPYVALIKDIIEGNDGKTMLTVQWFYRPEDVAAPRRNGRNLESSSSSVGARELFYSFHKDEVPAESIIHKCRVHFITKPNHIPERKRYPGFIVQKVYNPNSNRLIKLTNNSFLPDMKQEIDLLVQKTMRHLGILPDPDVVKSTEDR